MKEHPVRVVQTQEGLYLHVSDVLHIIARLCKIFPSKTLRLLWDVLHLAREEYVNGTQNNGRD